MITKIDGITYGKPSVTDLPPELGKQIIKGDIKLESSRQGK